MQQSNQSLSDIKNNLEQAQADLNAGDTQDFEQQQIDDAVFKQQQLDDEVRQLESRDSFLDIIDPEKPSTNPIDEEAKQMGNELQRRYNALPKKKVKEKIIEEPKLRRSASLINAVKSTPLITLVNKNISLFGQISNKKLKQGQVSVAQQCNQLWQNFSSTLKSPCKTQQEADRKKQEVKMVIEGAIKNFRKKMKGKLSKFKIKKGCFYLSNIIRRYWENVDSQFAHSQPKTVEGKRGPPKLACVVTVQNPNYSPELRGKAWDEKARWLEEEKLKDNDDKWPELEKNWKKGHKTTSKLVDCPFVGPYLKRKLTKLTADDETIKGISICIEHTKGAVQLYKKIKKMIDEENQWVFVLQVTEETIYCMIQQLLAENKSRIYPANCPTQKRKGNVVKIPQAKIRPFSFEKNYLKKHSGSYFYTASSNQLDYDGSSNKVYALICCALIEHINDHLQMIIDDSAKPEQGLTRHAHLYIQFTKKLLWKSFDNFLREVWDNQPYGFMKQAVGSPASNKQYHSKETPPLHWISGKFVQLRKEYQQHGLQQLEQHSCTEVEELFLQDKSMPASLYNFLKGIKTYVDPLHFTEIQRRYVYRQYARLKIKLLPWQFQLIMTIFTTDVDDPQRFCWWLWEAQGKSGKNWLIDLLIQEFDAIIVTLSDALDMKHFSFVYKQNKIVILNLVQSDNLNDPRIFQVFEQVQQSQYPASRKYSQKPQPKIPTLFLVFSNGAPWTWNPFLDKANLSLDRWIILKIEDSKKEKKKEKKNFDWLGMKRSPTHIPYELHQQLLQAVDTVKKTTKNEFLHNSLSKFQTSMKDICPKKPAKSATLSLEKYLQDRKETVSRDFHKYWLVLQYPSGRNVCQALCLDNGLPYPCDVKKVQHTAFFQHSFNDAYAVRLDTKEAPLFSKLLIRLSKARTQVLELQTLYPDQWTFKGQMKLLKKAFNAYTQKHQLNRFKGKQTSEFLESFNKLNGYQQ